MVEALGSLEQDGGGLGFQDKLAILVDRKFAWRDNQALQQRLKRARLRGGACVEDIDYRAARGLDRSVVRALAAESNWVKQHQNLFITGPCGVGKSGAPAWRDQGVKELGWRCRGAGNGEKPTFANH